MERLGLIDALSTGTERPRKAGLVASLVDLCNPSLWRTPRNSYCVRKAFPGVAAILLIGSFLCLGHGEVFASESDEDAVRKTINGFAETWNRHDIDALANLFTSEADFVIITGQRWKGRREIQRHLSHLHGTIPPDSSGLPPQFYGVQKTITYRFNSVDVRFVHKDVAVAYVDWVQLGDPRFPEPRRGTLSFVVTREGERWVIGAGHNTQAPVPAR